VRHIDPEQLALLALGDDAAMSDDLGHLAGCDRCRSELNGLRRTVELARADDGDDGWLAEAAPLPPPARVWDSIEAEVRADRERDARAAARAPQPATRPEPQSPAAAEPLPASGPAQVVPLDDRRRRSRTRAWWLVAACLVGLVVGVIIGAGARWNAKQAVTPGREEVIASTSLTALAGTPSDAAGKAEVVRLDDRLQLRVDARNLPLREGFYEVWMFDPGTNTMQPMGSLDVGHRTSFAIPSGVDIARFAGIDVSAEPFDGNPEHSAESVLRGQLRR